MRYNAGQTSTGGSSNRFSVLVFSAMCFVSLAILLSSHGCSKDISAHDSDPNSALAHEERPVRPVPSETSPPDLSGCTRLEIRYTRSTLAYFIPSTELEQGLLGPDEKERIESIKFFTITDPRGIAAFAHDVSLGTYRGPLAGKGWPMMAEPVAVDCYHDQEHIISFTVDCDVLITSDRRIFKYPTYIPSLKLIEPTEMQPFKLRLECALNMTRLHGSAPLSLSYPDPTRWCDIVLEYRTDTRASEEQMRGWFKCPSARKGKCHYALNPDCKAKSPRDTVLLFETKAGWNQHGGPELFTFDNHDPKGGCVLLNDGTVKFVRTKEELLQLRWK